MFVRDGGWGGAGWQGTVTWTGGETNFCLKYKRLVRTAATPYTDAQTVSTHWLPLYIWSQQARSIEGTCEKRLTVAVVASVWWCVETEDSMTSLAGGRAPQRLLR